MNQPRGFSSGLLTADGAVRVGKGFLLGFTVNNDAGGVNDATGILYDNASAASGTVLAKLVAAATEVSSVSITFPNPIQCENGIFLDITGTGAEVIVYYQ
jgi:hypothetical protein